MRSRSIAGTGSAVKRPGSYEFSAANVSAASVGRDLDPLMSIDHFTIRAPVFAPHPHNGFSVVTYLFEDGEGEFVSRDGLGHEVVAHPGAVIWTVTGSGIVHKEFPRGRGARSHGLQMFIGLLPAERTQAPRVLFVDGPQVPVLEGKGMRARVIAGAAGGVRAKIEPPGEVSLLDVKLDPGAELEQALPRDWNALAYVIEGSVLAGGEGHRLGPLDAASFAADGDGVLVRAAAGAAHVVLIAGRPVREQGRAQ